MASLNTSSTVRYGIEGAGKRLVLENDTSPGLVKDPGVSFVRVFPAEAQAKVTAVMGGATKTATNVPITIVDYVSFNGTASASLQYFPIGPVQIDDEKFFKAEPMVAYDADENSLVLDQSAFGIVKITYTAAYDRYRVTHGDSPCLAAQTQTQGGVPPTSTVVNYDPAFLVAEADGWETGSIEVAGPPCEGQDGYNSTAPYSDYNAVGLVLEEDTAYPAKIHPYYFSASKMPLGFTLTPQRVVVDGQTTLRYAGCKVRVYPRIPVNLIGVNCAVSQGSVGQGSLAVLQAHTFSGSQSINLDYPPSGVVSVSGLSAAIDMFNNPVTVQFAKPGDWVNEVVWQNANTFRLAQGARQVRPDEVVTVTTLGNNTIPCFTFCEVQYSADYLLFDVLFNFDEQIGWYAPAMVLAVAADGRRGSLDLRPPARGGVL